MDQILTLISTQRIRNPEILNILTEDDIRKIKLEIGEQCKSEKSDIKILKILLQIIGISDIQYDNTKTALMLACSSTNNPREKTIELLKYNPDVNKKDNEGKTAMDYACEKGHIYTFRSLMEHSVKQLTETLTNLQTKNEELKTEYTSSQTEIEELKTQLTKVQTENKNENEELKQQLSNLQNKPKLLTSPTSTPPTSTSPTPTRKMTKTELKEFKVTQEEKSIEMLMEKYFSDNEENITNNILKCIERGEHKYTTYINGIHIDSIFNNLNICDIFVKFFDNAYKTNKLDKSIKYDLCRMGFCNYSIEFRF